VVVKRSLWVALSLLLLPALSFAQQTGVVAGKVVDSGGLVLPGVTIEARAEGLPSPRVTVTDGRGVYRLQALPPGLCTITYELSGLGKVTREVMVQLAQDTIVDVTMSVAGVAETVVVSATIVPVIEKDSAAIKSGVSSETIKSLPVGQEYRDLIKLIPGVQYTQDSVRGPSAGGSGQDNVYKFDGVNVTLPMYGTLSAEPASYDIAQVTTIKGGAKAVDFERAGGFSVDTVSKSGTSAFHGQVSYQLQNPSMAAAVVGTSLSKYDQTRDWLTMNVGGPAIKNKLFFYGSYYRPTVSRNNASNAYGTLPGYESVRNEGFVKGTIAPVNSLLVNVTWRQSHRLETGSTFGQTSSATTGSGNEAWQKIGTADGSWIVNPKSFVTFKYTYFANPTTGRPDYAATATPSQVIGAPLDLANLDKIGQFGVPSPITGQDAFNSFISPLIQRYGYPSSTTGQMTGGGTVGYYTEYNQQDFYRNAIQAAYNLTLGSTVRQDLHAGVQYSSEAEDLLRYSNGWGSISVPGGRLTGANPAGPAAYYMATYLQQSTGLTPSLHSEYHSLNIEANDTINLKNLVFNVGFVFSSDTLFGQGLREDSSKVSGFVSAPGNKYKMYSIPFGKTLQPRLSTTWSYNGRDTVYASYARYVPAVSSLPRAASWDRNTSNQFIDAYFDQAGLLIGSVPRGSSSGKMFVQDMTPRTTTEYLVGTSKQITKTLSGRAYFRYRYSDHFWEDTNNNARVVYAPPPGIPQTLYIPNLSDMLTQIGSGSPYVIAELDGAYTKYYEATVEGEWRTRKSYLRGSYTWTKYTGNFDQDATTSVNDTATFMGSSYIGDGVGRQLWNFRDGTLHGDRPLSLKLYGYYILNWNATVGAYAIVQSGQPWEKWDYVPYLNLSTSTTETSKYGEPAGSRRTPTHYQLDLNYTQNVRLKGRYSFQLSADLFNVFNKQTGYNYNPFSHSTLFNTPRSYMDPRRLQIAARFQF
jgi:hypothetical protein